MHDERPDQMTISVSTNSLRNSVTDWFPSSTSFYAPSTDAGENENVTRISDLASAPRGRDPLGLAPPSGGSVLPFPSTTRSPVSQRRPRCFQETCVNRFRPECVDKVRAFQCFHETLGCAK